MSIFLRSVLTNVMQNGSKSSKITFPAKKVEFPGILSPQGDQIE